MNHKIDHTLLIAQRLFDMLLGVCYKIFLSFAIKYIQTHSNLRFYSEIEILSSILLPILVSRVFFLTLCLAFYIYFRDDNIQLYVSVVVKFQFLVLLLEKLIRQFLGFLITMNSLVCAYIACTNQYLYTLSATNLFTSIY